MSSTHTRPERVEGVVEGLQGSCFQVDVSQIAAHEADDPNAVVNLLDANALSDEDDREVDFLAVDTDAAAGGDEEVCD
jgi:hypothetical protein